MKRKANWILVGTPWLIAACAAGTGIPECPAGDTVRVTSKRGELAARPECITVARGSSFTLQLRDRPAAGMARTRPDSETNPGAGWLQRANEEGRDIVISVPAGAPAADLCDDTGCYYKYEIEVDGVGVLDPRVRVR